MMHTPTHPSILRHGGRWAGRAGFVCLLLLLTATLLAQGDFTPADPQALPQTYVAGPPPAPGEFKNPPSDAERTATGLVSKLLKPGINQLRPDANDLVSVHFVGWTPAGVEFENSYAQGKPGMFNLEQVFPGWREGIQLMKVGERRRLWIPAELAPKNPKGGPSGAVVFDVELLGFLPIPSAPEHLKAPPPGAERTPSGAFTQRLAPGTGTVHPTRSDAVLLQYTAWDTEGKVFDSTIPRKRPTLFPLEKVMPAFAECVQTMVEGERRYFWIPGNVAAGQWPNAPNGMLIFEVELLGVTDSKKIFAEPPPKS